MKVIEYLNTKYSNGPMGILACEARAFGIPYPLRHGWLDKYAQVEITPEKARHLRNALNKSVKRSASSGLRALDALSKSNRESEMIYSP